MSERESLVQRTKSILRNALSELESTSTSVRCTTTTNNTAPGNVASVITTSPSANNSIQPSIPQASTSRASEDFR